MKTYILGLMLISSVSYAEIVYVNPPNQSSSSHYDVQYSLGYTHYDISAVGNTKDSVDALNIGADIQTQYVDAFDFYYGLKGSLQVNPTADKYIIMPTLALKVGLPIFVGNKISVGVSGFVGASYIYFKQEQKSWHQVNELNGAVLNYGYAGEVNYQTNKNTVWGFKLETNKVLINSMNNSTMQGLTPSLTLKLSF